MTAKLLMAVTNDEGDLMINGELLAKRYLERGWTIAAAIPGASMRSVWLVITHDNDEAA